MIKKIPLLATAVLLSLPWSCAGLLPQPGPEDALRSSQGRPGISLSDLKLGRSLYVRNCAGCHTLHAPSQLDAVHWERTMSIMQVRAKIDDATRDSIMNYLLAFAKDGEKP